MPLGKQAKKKKEKKKDGRVGRSYGIGWSD